MGNIVILTGAGISAESGIATFRGSDGLWEGHEIEKVATPKGFEEDPALVHEFYNQRRRQLLLPNIKPNAAHKALVELEEKWEGDVAVVTQNVDDLHERAGSHFVLHMHGELLRVRCCGCGGGKMHSGDITLESVCDICHRKGMLRPDIVWFGEMPKHMEDIERMLKCADLFLSIGTSSRVYPAAGFVDIANHHGVKTVEINLDESEASSAFDLSIRGKAGEKVPEFVRSFLASGIEL